MVLYGVVLPIACLVLMLCCIVLHCVVFFGFVLSRFFCVLCFFVLASFTDFMSCKFVLYYKPTCCESVECTAIEVLVWCVVLRWCYAALDCVVYRCYVALGCVAWLLRCVGVVLSRCYVPLWRHQGAVSSGVALMCREGCG